MVRDAVNRPRRGEPAEDPRRASVVAVVSLMLLEKGFLRMCLGRDRRCLQRKNVMCRIGFNRICGRLMATSVQRTAAASSRPPGPAQLEARARARDPSRRYGRSNRAAAPCVGAARASAQEPLSPSLARFLRARAQCSLRMALLAEEGRSQRRSADVRGLVALLNRRWWSDRLDVSWIREEVADLTGELRRADPLGLCGRPFGAPDDEYEVEALAFLMHGCGAHPFGRGNEDFPLSSGSLDRDEIERFLAAPPPTLSRRGQTGSSGPGESDDDLPGLLLVICSTLFGVPLDHPAWNGMHTDLALHETARTCLERARARGREPPFASTSTGADEF